MSVEDLRKEVRTGRNTAFETIRALDALGLISRPSYGEIELVKTNPLAEALVGMLSALKPYENVSVRRTAQQKDASGADTPRVRTGKPGSGP